MLPTIIGHKMGQISCPKVSISSSFKACQAEVKNSSKLLGVLLCSSLSNLRPVYSIATQIIGNVQGLPIRVPIALAIILPPNSHALPAAMAM